MTIRCQICDTEYKHCPHCEKANSYKNVADTPVCYKIYLVLYELRENVIDKDKAKQELAMVGVTEKTLSNFKLISAVRNKIADIVKDEAVEIVAESEKEVVVTKNKNKFKHK